MKVRTARQLTGENGHTVKSPQQRATAITGSRNYRGLPSRRFRRRADIVSLEPVEICSDRSNAPFAGRYESRSVTQRRGVRRRWRRGSVCRPLPGPPPPRVADRSAAQPLLMLDRRAIIARHAPDRQDLAAVAAIAGEPGWSDGHCGPEGRERTVSQAVWTRTEGEQSQGH